MSTAKHPLALVMSQIMISRLPPGSDYTSEGLRARLIAVDLFLPNEMFSEAAANGFWKTVATSACKRGLLVRSPEKREIIQGRKKKLVALYVRTDATHVIADPGLLMEAHRILDQANVRRTA